MFLPIFKIVRYDVLVPTCLEDIDFTFAKTILWFVAETS